MTQRAREKTTIVDVANAAGVSIATVSRVINNNGKVSVKTKKKVLEAIQATGFQPALSSFLVNGENPSILMCVSSLSNPFSVSVIAGAQACASRHQFELMLIQIKDRYTVLSQYEDILKRHRFSGMIFLVSKPDANLVVNLNMRCPLVMCSEYTELANISYVSVDDYSAAKRAAQYLISTGRQRIAMLNGSLEKKYSQNRERGFREAMAEAGLPLLDSWVEHISSVEYSLAASYATHMLKQENRPDAIFASSDVFAAAAIKAAKRLGLRVPEDLSIVGFDDTDLSVISDPSITTVKQPSFQIGYQSCELLIERIRNPETETKQILLDTELIIRDSTLPF